MNAVEKMAEALALFGLLALEAFVTVDGKLLFNEIAPRPHNSFHWTIEGCATASLPNSLACWRECPLARPISMATGRWTICWARICGNCLNCSHQPARMSISMARPMPRPAAKWGTPTACLAASQYGDFNRQQLSFQFGQIKGRCLIEIIDPVADQQKGKGPPEIDRRARRIIIWEITDWQRRVQPLGLIPMIFIGQRFRVIFKMVQNKEITALRIAHHANTTAISLGQNIQPSGGNISRPCFGVAGNRHWKAVGESMHQPT